eukprot:6190386-Pleurochrysis_carterae.AAC.1
MLHPEAVSPFRDCANQTAPTCSPASCSRWSMSSKVRLTAPNFRWSGLLVGHQAQAQSAAACRDVSARQQGSRRQNFSSWQLHSRYEGKGRGAQGLSGVLIGSSNLSVPFGHEVYPDNQWIEARCPERLQLDLTPRCQPDILPADT